MEWYSSTPALLDAALSTFLDKRPSSSLSGEDVGERGGLHVEVYGFRMRCRALALIALLAPAIVVACTTEPPCTPAGCTDWVIARFEVQPSILVLNGGTVSLCRNDDCLTARIRFDNLDSGTTVPLAVNCPVSSPPSAVEGVSIHCSNEFEEPSKGTYIEKVVAILYIAPQRATPIEKDVLTIRLTNVAGDVVAERTGSPVFTTPNPPAASCNPYCTVGTL